MELFHQVSCLRHCYLGALYSRRLDRYMTGSRSRRNGSRRLNLYRRQSSRITRLSLRSIGYHNYY